MNCPKCGGEMKNCCAEAMKGNYTHSCGESEDICQSCGYRQVSRLPPFPLMTSASCSINVGDITNILTDKVRPLRLPECIYCKVKIEPKELTVFLGLDSQGYWMFAHPKCFKKHQKKSKGNKILILKQEMEVKL